MSLLIKELVEDVQYISEDILNEAGEKTGKNYFIEGIIMQGDIKNRNGRNIRFIISLHLFYENI